MSDVSSGRTERGGAGVEGASRSASTASTVERTASRHQGTRCGARPVFWMGLAVVAVVAGVIQMLESRRPPLVREAARGELILRENRLYRRGEAQPFSGAMVEHYPNRNLQSRSLIVNGVLHGLSEGWHTNGQIQVREFFREGGSHGLRTKWHPNGTNLSEVRVVNGKLDGVFLRWHENGALAERVPMRAGQPDGTSESFYPSGFLKARATLREGRLVAQQHWPDGERKANPHFAGTN